ncbi:MAG: hypothetical protein B6A08_07305 [Sorangiineae bacterium NIC37A_2]|jgi:hypothetical protein|nr:MAG: hypothetical protein B6A08_07305 [Sorangiineae bacterium NIC37A_2]
MTTRAYSFTHSSKLLRLASALAILCAALVWAPQSAQAENLIRRPGAHNRYTWELEPHLNIHWGAGAGRAHVGPGIRASIPFMHNGPISSINNNMAITFGLDFYFPPGGFAAAIPVAAQWNFYFTDIVSVLGEVGVVGNFASHGINLHVLDPYIQGGGRFQFGKVGVLVRVGYPSFSVGANFQF